MLEGRADPGEAGLVRTGGEGEPPRDEAEAVAHQAITTVEETFQDHMEIG